ncbi:MAG: polysaccharide biosynthesis/export family protein [Prevotella sp.]|nr:polysaccharide biosynthesis/export family protein [Prevotella sp.]
MKKSKRKYLKWAFFGMMGVLVSISCTTPKNISYFQDTYNGQVARIAYSQGIKLKPGDMISIVVKSKSVELTNALNLPVTTQIIGAPEETSLRQSQGVGGYTLDHDGNIDFPLVGSIHVAGKDKSEVASTIKQILKDQQIATDAVVTVEYINLNYAVMGEVKAPGQFSFNKERISILEALSTAGDLTLYGRRDSIIVWRENEGQRQTYVVSILNGNELINSPAYYLQQGDIVYVQPNNYRKRQSRANGNEVLSGSFWLSAISVLTTLGVLLFK